MKWLQSARRVVFAGGVVGGGFVLPALASNYVQTNLVSTDVSIAAAAHDTDLVNAWGIAEGPSGPFWISDNGSGLSTIYNSAGTKQGLVVTIPGAAGGAAAPTGIVYNGTAGFGGDPFIFASEDGVISGWRGALGTTAEILANNSSGGAVYKGLALNPAAPTLYAADFHNARIDTFGAAITGNFIDPNLPAGFAPFNVAQIGGKIYVTYAKQDADKKDDVPGSGNGYVDTYDLEGNFSSRLVSGGNLNSPWAVLQAPAGFGDFAGDLLVGNFGDGFINVYDPANGDFLGQVSGSGGPISIEGLWGLVTGNGNGLSGGDLDKVYFTAGPESEGKGLFGSLAVGPATVPEPGTLGVLGLGGLMLGRRRRVGK